MRWIRHKIGWPLISALRWPRAQFRILGWRIERWWRLYRCKRSVHVEREIAPGMLAVRAFGCECGYRYREYERPKAVST